MTLPSSTHIGRVALRVASLDRSLAFYREGLGFVDIDRTRGSRGPIAHLGGADGVVQLELHEHPGVRRQPARGLVGLYHFAVLLPTRADLGHVLRRAFARGLRVSSADHLVSEALYLVDPDGLTVEVYRDRPREEWQFTGGEIAMATLPLDTDGVLASAEDGSSRSALPAGTTIGHMHFYVRDLAEADRFYCAGLGFDPILRSFPGALFVSAGGYHHHVGLNTWAAHMPAAGLEDSGLLSWQLILPDQAVAVSVRRRLEEAGYDCRPSASAVAATDASGNTVMIEVAPESA